jgi:hypothetical protein
MANQITRAGASVRQALDRLRDQIQATRKTISEISSAPVPADEVRARLEKAIAAAVYAQVPENSFESFAGADHNYGTLPVELKFTDLAYLFGTEAVTELILKRISARDRKAGLPSAKRVVKVAELAAQLEDLERQEELEILRMESAGHAIVRRADASPELLFQIWATA